MSLSRKRPTFLRFILCIFLGLLISGGILLLVQRAYQEYLERSALREPYLILAGISALLIALFLVFPARKPWRLFKWLGRLLVMALAVALLWGGGLIYLVQNDFIYYPGLREQNAEAALITNPAVEEMALSGADGARYTGYFWKTAPTRAGLILYFGGNAEPAAARVDALIRQNAAAFIQGYHFMMVDYPGYGESTGEPKEESIRDMADAALAYALGREDVDAARLVFAGWSLGSGTASRLASAKQAAGLILLAPFYNGTELVNANLDTQNVELPRFLSRLPSVLVRNKFPNDANARMTTIPTLVIAAQDDRVIPPEQAQRLAALYAKGEFLLVPGGHTAPWSDMQSLMRIQSFLAGLPSVAP